MKVRYSPRAIGDLASIADYLVTRSPRGARSVDARIRKTIDLIATIPGSGRVLEHRPAVRVMPVGRHPYLVFYTLSENQVLILHIRHGARSPVDPAKL